MSRWNGRAGALLCGLVVAMLLATSCGSDSSDGSSGDPSGPATTEASGPTDVDPSGVLKMTYPLANKGGAVPFDGDPTHDSGEYNDGLLYMIYGRLLRPTADGGLVPDQAESVTVSLSLIHI